jgi:hypothetical protein
LGVRSYIYTKSWKTIHSYGIHKSNTTISNLSENEFGRLAPILTKAANMVGIPTYTREEISYILQEKRKNLQLPSKARKPNGKIAEEVMNLNRIHKARFHDIPPNGINYIWHKHKDDPKYKDK